ncbi:MAG: HAD family hydrolase [Ruminococcaceae bacterium]|nr:HAD family hydrolase [Oscillospiraceae bacterium]
MVKYVLFDLDGTLTDPAEGITSCIMFALSKMGRDIPPRSELYKFIGPPLVPSFMEFLGMTREEAEEALRLYRSRFSTIGWRENRAYDGIHEQLRLIKDSGKRLALATSKPEQFALNIMKEFSLAEYFDVICGSSLDGSRVEKGDVIRYALDTLGASASDGGEIIMIGDRKFDVIGAKEVGATSIGVLWGYGDERELIECGANYICRSVDSLAECVAVIG